MKMGRYEAVLQQHTNSTRAQQGGPEEGPAGNGSLDLG